jgi:hypothetical protein
MTDTTESKKPRVVKTLVPLPKRSVPVYFGTRIAQALHEVTVDMNLYKGFASENCFKPYMNKARRTELDK